MTDFLTKLFTGPSGWAVLLAGGALIIFWGQAAKKQQGNLFQIRSEYDRRNAHQYSNQRDWYSNPFGGVVNSLPLRARSINIRTR